MKSLTLRLVARLFDGDVQQAIATKAAVLQEEESKADAEAQFLRESNEIVMFRLGDLVQLVELAESSWATTQEHSVLQRAKDLVALRAQSLGAV